MRAPDFWWQPEPNPAARLLAPFGSIYGAIAARRMARQGARAHLPVLCIGNFVAGGAGKTPAAIAIAKRLQAMGEKPAFLSRGYRGKTGTPCHVDISCHSAQDVGDEALLLARVAPVFIGADRAASAGLAADIGASVIILDDGLQSPSVHHDWRLAVVDAKAGAGNGFCIPAGPLRAPLSAQLRAVAAILFIGEGQKSEDLIETVRKSGKRILHAKLAADAAMSGSLAGGKVVAFAGIGLPRKFRATLEAIGCDIVGWHSFPDHHAYSLKQLRRLQAEAGAKHAQLVTTEKDFARITTLLGLLDRNLPQPIALPVELIFDDPNGIDDLLAQALTQARQVRRVTASP